MSINLENPETLLGKVDAASNFITQIRIALMVGDTGRARMAVEEANRHIVNAQEQIEKEWVEQP